MSSEDVPTYEDAVAVLHGLTDWRLALSAEEVMTVASMSYQQRAELFAERIEQAHAEALAEQGRRSSGTGSGSSGHH